ncbi:hypothetical protein D1871_23065 [Nakamurella silvestris]|nr:hypothetical protein D1871_23065 [Nakamurella silvestris]
MTQNTEAEVTHRFAVGEEWVFRAQDFAQSERVRVIEIIESKVAKVTIEFLDGKKAGKRSTVSSRRLGVPWLNVAAYDEAMANWDRIRAYELDNVEEYCVDRAFADLPESIAERYWGYARFATAVHDPTALSILMGVPIERIAEQVDSYAPDGLLVVSGEGTLMIAEQLCRSNPTPILAAVMKEEAEQREKAKHGGTQRNYAEGRDEKSSPEWEYHWYLHYIRPRHELLRQWCGHRAVTLHERLEAAESETNRLDILVARLIDTLKENGQGHYAKTFEEEHERDRIWAWKARPVVERPIHPSEMPVVERPRRRRWGS